CDIYGPSIPLMLGIQNVEPTMTMAGKVIPVVQNNLKVMSIGIVAGDDAPLIWRGPMVTQVTRQFLHQVDWGKLDILVIDLPPGTGDVQITLCQSIPLSGAVIVSTPQDMSFSIARKAFNMFQRLEVPVIGLVENMSFYQCKNCHQEIPLFGNKPLEMEGAPLLGRIPIDPKLVLSLDRGENLFLLSESSPAQEALTQVGDKVLSIMEEQLEKREKWKQSDQYIQSIQEPKPGELEIHWGSGKTDRFSAFELRLACPCAMCLDEWTGEKILREDSIPLDIYPQKIHLVGNYAIQIEWSDGHKTGIYTYQYLHKLAETRKKAQEEAFEI
ncbi:MAG: DUF971 domain-containing protein, partial [Planctomycetota bacterium]